LQNSYTVSVQSSQNVTESKRYQLPRKQCYFTEEYEAMIRHEGKRSKVAKELDCHRLRVKPCARPLMSRHVGESTTLQLDKLRSVPALAARFGSVGELARTHAITSEQRELIYIGNSSRPRSARTQAGPFPLRLRRGLCLVADLPDPAMPRRSHRPASTSSALIAAVARSTAALATASVTGALGSR